jgi:plasmid rolling circle replication initiator protein Rep
MKTATFKYADMGFISNSPSKINVEIYGVGQPLMSLEINAMNVCMSTFQCMEKKDFNEKVLHVSYPETLLENIFRAKPIFNKKSVVKTEDGFSQKLTKENEYDISYRVKGNQRIFRDTLNKILIKVREE